MNFFMHIVLKHLPKFLFFQNSRIGQNTKRISSIEMKVFDPSIIIDGTNKEKVTGI